MSLKDKPRLQPASSTRWLFEQHPIQQFAKLVALTATEPRPSSGARTLANPVSAKPFWSGSA